MASPNNPPSVAELIRKHSKARVLHVTPVGHFAAKYMNQRQLIRHDVVEALVRQYA